MNPWSITTVAIGIFAGLVLSATSGFAGPYKSVRDWSVYCSNGLSCTVRTSNDAHQIYAFGFERGPEANAPVVLFLSTGLTLNEESDLVIRIDDQPELYLEIPKADFKEGVWRFVGQDVDLQILTAMRHGQKMKLKVEAAEGDREIPVSLSGVTASLLYLDEVQGRVGNQDALEAKGDGEATAATTRVHDLASVDELPVEVKRRWAATPDDCSESYDDSDLIKSYGGLAVDLKDNASLYVLPCGSPGAYNLPQVVLVYDGEDKTVRTVSLPVMGERGPTVMDIPYNTSWDDHASTLTAFFKGRGLGDCGSRQIWVLNANGYYSNFELIEERVKGNCDGKYDDWPIIWPVK